MAISALTAWAELVFPAKALDALIAEADLIVVGSFLTKYAAAGPVDGDLIAEKALKGVLPSSSVKVRWIGSPGRPNAIPPERGLLFLKKHDPWVVLPILSTSDFDTSGWIPLLPENRAIPTLPAATPKLRILVELAHSARSILGEMQLENLCRMSPEALIDTRAAAALRSSSERGEACLTGHGDPTAILDLERREQQRSQGASGGRDYLLRQLRFQYRSPDGRAIAALARLTSNAQVRADARQAAATALARIHTRQTLPLLATLIDLPDPFFQAAGVGGLAGFANNVQNNQPAPGDWKYRTSDTMKHSIWSPEIVAADPRYLAFWKDWWRKNRPELTGQ